jgi:hypothetical protein
MAGRPRTMARCVVELLERHAAIVDELTALMPKQYVAPESGGELGEEWRKAVIELIRTNAYPDDLAVSLAIQAELAGSSPAVRILTVICWF